MLNRVVTIVVLVPVAVVLIALAVANRASTPFTLDPFHPGNPGLTVSLPLFVWLFAALVLGLVVGSVATWFSQGRYRRKARERGTELRSVRQQQAARAPAGPALPPASRKA